MASDSGNGSGPPSEWWSRAGARSAADSALELGDVPLPGGSSAVALQSGVRRRRPSAHAHRSLAWRMCHGVLLRVGRSERLQRTGLRMAIAAGLCVVILGGVSVIMLNNIVIKRTAELGKLDTTRRNLLVDNALDSAQIATLSAPTRIVRLAEKHYGMQDTSVMQQFIWLRPRAGEDSSVGLQKGDKGLATVAPVVSAVAAPTATTAAPTSTTAAATPATSAGAAR